jgi:hypothetical protein
VPSGRLTKMADSTETDWIRIAITSQLVMLIYFTIDNHVYLYPWNNLRSPAAELPSTLSGWIPFFLIMLAFAFRMRWGMLVGTGGMLVGTVYTRICGYCCKSGSGGYRTCLGLGNQAKIEYPIIPV